MNGQWLRMVLNCKLIHVTAVWLLPMAPSGSPFKSVAMDIPFTAPVSLPTTSCSHQCCLKTRPACAWLSSCCTWWILGPRVGNLGQPGQPPETPKIADCRWKNVAIFFNAVNHIFPKNYHAVYPRFPSWQAAVSGCYVQHALRQICNGGEPLQLCEGWRTTDTSSHRV